MATATTTSTTSRSHQIIQLMGILVGAGDASARLRAQYGIPESVIKGAYHNGVWDVTALLPYIK